MKNDHISLSRRHALKWLAGTAAAPAALAAPGETEPAPPAYPTRYDLHDPDYSKASTGPWVRLMSAEELKTTTVLADLFLPKDADSPAASEVGVPEFINEWISAPYAKQREDREVIRGGLSWLNTEGFKRHGKIFVELTDAQQFGILDEIGTHPFFTTFRHLAVGGYYTHSDTWKSLGYIGNVSLGGPYPGVPKEVIEQFGLQDVA